jgi:hypothetical protein
VWEDIRRGCRRDNIVEILHMYVNGKMRPVETMPGGRGIKEKDGGGEFNCDIL